MSGKKNKIYEKISGEVINSGWEQQKLQKLADAGGGGMGSRLFDTKKYTQWEIKEKVFLKCSAV